MEVDQLDEDAIREQQAETAEERREEEAEAAGAGDPEPEACTRWRHCAFSADHAGVCRDVAGQAETADVVADEAETAEKEAERIAKRAEKDEAAAEAADIASDALRAMAATAEGSGLLPATVSRSLPGTDTPIVPSQREMAGLAAMAVTLSAAQALPVALRNRPNDVFLVLLTARDLGIAITTAIREFHVIDGRVTLSPKSKLAMLNERGARMGWAVWPDPTNDAKKATWHATRADRPGVEFSYSFTIEDANTAGLKGKDNWKSYPQRMLSWRAVGYLVDDVFPEVGTGLYSPDEMGAVTDEEGNPVIDVRTMEPLMGMKAPRAGGGGGSGDTNSGDDPAPAEEKEALRVRLDLLKPEHFDREPEDNGPTCRDALMQLWLAKLADGSPREGGHPLPPWNSLTVSQMRLATAMVKGIEDRARKGEWGPWNPADPETGEKQKDDPDGGSGGEPDLPLPDRDEPAGDAENQPAEGSESSPEQPAGDAATDTAPSREIVKAEHVPAAPEPDLVQRIIDEVKAMDPGKVRAELAKRTINPAGTKVIQQQRLAEAMLKEALAAQEEASGGQA